MATRIRIKRGTESQITGYTGTQYEGELAYATNTGEVFVNNGTQFISVSGSSETPTLQSVTDAGAITTNDITTGSVTSNGNFLITGNDSTVQLRGSSVDFNIQTTAADNVARIATTTGGSARLDLYNHIPGFNGALEFRATSWENNALVISGGTPNTTKFLVSRDPNAATLQVTGESYFTGNVGIGTTAPSSTLHVAGTARIHSAANGAFGTLTLGSINHIVGDVQYINFKNNNNSWMMILNGNVGIGTTAPLAKLHIKDGNTLTTALPNTSALIEGFSQSILQVASHSTGYSQLAFGDQDDGFDGGLIYSNASRYLAIEAANVERMRFTSDGNVGIGTTAPTQKLDVSGTIKVNTEGHQIALYRGDGITLVGRLSYTGTTLRIAGNDGIRFEDTNGSTIHGVITDAGNFGIGTTSPTSNLHINGTAMSQFRLEVPGGPSSNTDTSGREGDFAYDDQYLYVKTGSGWGRVALDFAF